MGAGHSGHEAQLTLPGLYRDRQRMSPVQANRDGRLVVARVGLGELVMNVTRTIRYRTAPPRARALAASSTVGAIRDGVSVGDRPAAARREWS
jgi:hypothetical protein